VVDKSASVLFEARGLCKEYRPRARLAVRAVDAVSLTIPRGSFAVLTGPSGSGKTTLLALLGGLDRPGRGEVLFEGHDLARLSDVGLARMRRRFGFVFQDFALIGGLPVWENVTYPLIPRGVLRRQRRDIARTVLAQLGLAGKEHARLGELSGGEQQRVAFARALAGRPEVLLADEPTSNLDQETGRQVCAMLHSVHGAGATVIVASHDPAVAAMATMVYALNEGKLVRAFAPTDER